MINHFKIITCGLIALIIASIFGVGIYVLTITNDKLLIILTFICIFLIDSLFGIYIINSKRHINTKTCWILALVYLPLIGVVLFLIFGIKSLSERTLKQHADNMLKYAKYENYDYTDVIVNSQKNSIFSYGYKTSLRPIYLKNNINLINDTSDFYIETIRLIRSAKKFIHIQMYILNDGFFLRTIFAELIKKAKQNIKIRFIYDWYGSYHKYKRRMINELKRNKIEVGIFNPKGINMFKGLTNYRSHKKALIIDNEVCLYGGSNFGDEYLDMNPETFHFRDLNYVISGEIVNTINLGFCDDWLNYTSYTLSKDIKKSFSKQMKDILKIKPNNERHINMQMIYNSPMFVERGISDVIIKLILDAKNNIKIVTPYFLPTIDVKQAIRIALKSGINIQFIFPGKRDDKDFILTMNRNAYKELLDLGCDIYEYNGFIHSKFLIVDDRYVLTGSNNFDFRSFIINFENALLIDDQQVAKQLDGIFDSYKHDAHKFTIDNIVPIISSFRHKWKILLLNLYKPIL